ncbi:MAG: DrmE family protein, partial [Leptospiraceae bacterium]|nr:DrmE family protein [Leptospiraceae bacterium]
MGSPEKKYQDWLLEQVLSVDNVLQQQSSFIGAENIEKLKSIMTDVMDDLLPGIETHSLNKFEEIQNVVHACPGHKVLLLCRHAEALEALKDRLDANPDLTFLTYDEISVAKNVYDIAIMAGWPGKHLFSKLFNSGVTDKIQAVLYQNEISALNSYFKQKTKAEEAVRLTSEQKAEIIGCPSELFNNSQPEKTAETDQNKSEKAGLDDIEAKEKTAIFNVDWSMRPKLPSVSGQQREQAIDAVYVSFNNDRCAYLTQNHRLPVIDPRTYQYKNKTVEELAAGDIVVFRQSGDREILREIAEKLYPESYEKLAVQAAEWKHWLNTLGTNVSDIWLKLSEHGLQRSFMTINNWVKNEDLIGPQNLKDILVIAETT